MTASGDADTQELTWIGGRKAARSKAVGVAACCHPIADGRPYVRSW